MGAEQDVARGHIAVGKPMAVQVGEGLRNGSQDRHRLPGAQLPPAGQEPAQRSAWGIVQHKPQAVLATVVRRAQPQHGMGPDQMAVVQCGEDADLPPHPLFRFPLVRRRPVRTGTVIETLEGVLTAS
ncbi:hypothetical protein BJG92_02763 [Arthrobacter sp. SO5]|nr:hypothetical protein [Arthrobacter sp. SO5]